MLLVLPVTCSYTVYRWQMLKKRLLKHILIPSPWERQKIVKDSRRKRGCCWLLFQIVLHHSSIQLYKCKIQNEKYYRYSQCTKVEHTIYFYTLFLGLNTDVHRASTINFPFVFLMERKTERRKRREKGCTHYLQK